MAHKIGVIEPRRSNPSTYIKKSAAQLLIRRLLAEWVIENVTVKLLDVQQVPSEAHTIRVHITPKSYIPAKLPSAEVPGVHFQLPQSPTWRRQHRLTVLGLEFVEKYPVEVQI